MAFGGPKADCNQEPKFSTSTPRSSARHRELKRSQFSAHTDKVRPLSGLTSLGMALIRRGPERKRIQAVEPRRMG